jgi:hypothetical protein
VLPATPPDVPALALSLGEPAAPLDCGPVPDAPATVDAMDVLPLPAADVGVALPPACALAP